MRSIIGIDPGLTSTGFGVIKADTHSFSHVQHGVIHTDRLQSRGERLVHLYRSLNTILDEFNPQEAGLESIFFAKNVKTAMPVAEARGVILMCLAQRNIPCHEYSPLEVKKAVLSEGRAGKAQVQKMVKFVFRLNTIPQPDHAADALAVALCHCNHTEREILSGIGTDKIVQ